MLQIINLTPHDITILNEQKEIVSVVPTSGKIARLDSDKELITAQQQGLFESKIPFFATKYGIPYLSKVDKKGNELERVQFPTTKENIIYIVSGLFRAGYNRSDFWQPGELIRNEKEQPIGCIGLSQ